MADTAKQLNYGEIHHKLSLYNVQMQTGRSYLYKELINVSIRCVTHLIWIHIEHKMSGGFCKQTCLLC